MKGEEYMYENLSGLTDAEFTGIGKKYDEEFNYRMKIACAIGVAVVVVLSIL